MLKGRNITLRPLKMSDWEKTIQWRNDIEIKKMAMMHPFPITEMVEKEWYENILKSTSNRTVYFTIVKKNDIPIGFVTLNKISYTHKNCALGIVIGEKDDQGKGYGKEAMALIISYAFNTLNLNKITVEVVENNKTAIALYKKLGFTEEGRLKQQFYAEGKYLDVIILAKFRQSKVLH
jgi:UDP-4-amino-4,6-dideoxy-N-acetyl-beta-L-altrosamine N-acetyltransferase